jgi:integrase
MRLRDVGVEDVDAYVSEKIDGEKLSPKTVNNHVTLARTILREWRLRHPGQLVFTNITGGRLSPSGRIFQEVLHRVLDADGFGNVPRGGKERPYVRFHDLRHTFASHWVTRRGDLFELQKILGHQSVQMTMRYAHLAPDAFCEDYGRFGDAIAVGDAEIVALTRQAT